jgi:hypothetical protein
VLLASGRGGIGKARAGPDAEAAVRRVRADRSGRDVAFQHDMLRCRLLRPRFTPKI